MQVHIPPTHRVKKCAFHGPYRVAYLEYIKPPLAISTRDLAHNTTQHPDAQHMFTPIEQELMDRRLRVLLGWRRRAGLWQDRCEGFTIDDDALRVLGTRHKVSGRACEIIERTTHRDARQITERRQEVHPDTAQQAGVNTGSAHGTWCHSTATDMLRGCMDTEPGATRPGAQITAGSRMPPSQVDPLPPLPHKSHRVSCTSPTRPR